MKDKNNSSAIIFLVLIWLAVLLFMGNSVYNKAVDLTGPRWKLENLQELLNGNP